jgi:hypothetical protein
MLAASSDACCSHALHARHLAEELELALARIKELEAQLKENETPSFQSADDGGFPWR